MAQLSAEETEWTEDEKHRNTLDEIPDLPSDWEIPMEHNGIICVIRAHGNVTVKEWGDIFTTELRVSTVLPAAIGKPGFLPVEKMKRIPRVIHENISKSKHGLASSIIDHIKDFKAKNADEARFLSDPPEYSEVSNKFRNRSWEFTNKDEGIYLYQYRGEKTVMLTIDLRTIPGCIISGGKIIVFKKGLFEHILSLMNKYKFPRQLLLVDASCNTREHEGVGTTEMRRYLSQFRGLDGQKKKFGGKRTISKYRRRTTRKNDL